MIWTIATGILCLFLGFIIGTNAGKTATIDRGFVGYYDVDHRTVYFDPKLDPQVLNDREYIVLECVDLANPINATKEAN